MFSVASSSSFFSRLLPSPIAPKDSRSKPRRSNFLSMTTRSRLDDSSALLQAAQYTVDTYIESGMVIGLGSGHASGMAIQYLGRQLRTGALKDIMGIPMSVSSASEAAKAGIPLDSYQDSSQSHWSETFSKKKSVTSTRNLEASFEKMTVKRSFRLMIDFAFDDADVIEEGTLIAIIGRRKLQGEESIVLEKSILNAANKLVFIIEENQYKGGLEGSIPVLVQSLNWLATAEEIDDLFLGDAEVWRKPSIGQAGPLGGDFPLMTKEGHNVLDVIFTSPIESLAEVAESLEKVEGVAGHGVISKYPCTVVIASQNGLNIVDKLTENVVG